MIGSDYLDLLLPFCMIITDDCDILAYKVPQDGEELDQEEDLMEDSRVEKLEQIHYRFKEKGTNIIGVLQEIQSEFKYIPEDTVYWFSEKTGIPASKFYGVITFYSQFHTKPRGDNIVTVCCGTVCHVKGNQRIITRLRDELGLKGNESTTRDGKYTMEKVACVGACSIAPVVLINSDVLGNMTPEKMAKTIRKAQDSRSEK